MSNKTDKWLASKDKGVTKTYGANGVLSRLYRKILGDLGIGPNRYGTLLSDYVMDSRHGVPDNKKDQTSMRGNMRKELSRPQMTWKVFCKGIRFLQVVRFVFIVELEHGTGRKTIHSTVVNLGKRRELKEFVDGLEQNEDDEAIEHSSVLDIDENGNEKQDLSLLPIKENV